MKILVLGGGDSPEREVSQRSAAAVRDALTDLNHEVGYFDPAGRLEELAEVARAYDVVLPILHGEGGEDGRVQRELEAAKVPYLGADVPASELCFDKVRLKQLLDEHGIFTPRWEVVTAESFKKAELAQAPFVLKPVGGGSSIDTLIVRSLPYDKTEAVELLKRHPEMLLEELVEGIEITVPVLGDEALPVIEIVPPSGAEFDYENKYNGATSELCPPQHVEAVRQHQAQRIAEQVHQLAGVRDLSRTDMMVRPDGRIYVLEINTLPGLTAQSLFPKAAKVAGYSWNELVAKFVELAKAHRAA
jgi:D-alanine-D-alanine ligase